MKMYESAECKSDISFLRFFIQTLNLGKLVPKLKSYWIYLNIWTRANLKVTKTNMTAMKIRTLVNLKIANTNLIL